MTPPHIRSLKREYFHKSSSVVLITLLSTFETRTQNEHANIRHTLESDCPLQHGPDRCMFCGVAVAGCSSVDPQWTGFSSDSRNDASTINWMNPRWYYERQTARLCGGDNCSQFSSRRNTSGWFSSNSDKLMISRWRVHLDCTRRSA